MTPSPAPLRHAEAAVAVVGGGQLGSALSRALREAGVRVDGPLGRGEDAASVDVVLLCVPDSEIAAAVRAHARDGRQIGHTSGATEVAQSGADFGLHPLQTFLGGEGLEAFDGIGCAIAGRTPAALATARRLASALGAIPFEIADDARPAYHAAASIASNYLVTLQAAAEQIAAGAGLSRGDARALLAPLVRSTVENWAAHGPASALTGPIARGDEATVARQRAAVAGHAAELLPLFDVLADRTRVLAATRETAP
ncbi:DUF2520 domain-containing protein [Microbacterium sp. 4R-513]|uniref:Rossmann-like and DUF2520 domain-containing protein n=1 Tax=Microbacterium sp. 4R-513 TaxID=2567934 RepID=UPI0013E14145|nr:Rossmann-like and DUF2520 domain-containing protein [Microbacterium sp. 4R-513]QIG39549.1 DUF2520 domain-containing protein [Microbacterium sp. 4R-513]